MVCDELGGHAAGVGAQGHHRRSEAHDPCTNHGTQPSIVDIQSERKDWVAALHGELEGVLGRSLSVGDPTRLCPPRRTLDDPAKYLLRWSSGEPAAVLYLAPATAPGIVHRHVDRAEAARRILGEPLGRVVLQPMCRGEWDDRSYALMPFCHSLGRTPLRHKVGRSLLRPSVFGWLRAVTARTARAPEPADGEAVRVLEWIRTAGVVAPRFQARLDQALRRLLDGVWVPRRVLMHGDLWADNILIAPRGLQGHDKLFWWDRFLIIDWPGSRTDGFAFYDLIRLALSLRTGPWRLRREVLAHAALLGCDPCDAWGYQAMALGSIGMNIEHFAPDQYRWIAHECLTCLESTGV